MDEFCSGSDNYCVLALDPLSGNAVIFHGCKCRCYVGYTDKQQLKRWQQPDWYETYNFIDSIPETK